MKNLSAGSHGRISKLTDVLASHPTTEMDACARDSFLVALTKLHSMAGQEHEALATAQQILGQSGRWSATVWTARILASQGKIDRSLEIALGIFEFNFQSDALADISKSAYDHSTLDAALAIVDLIPNPEIRWKTSLYFCNAEARACECSSSISISRGIGFASFRARAILVAAGCAQNQGDEQTTRTLLTEAQSIAAVVEDHLARSTILHDIAHFYSTLDDYHNATSLFRLAAASASMVEDPEKNLGALLLCGLAQTGISDFDGAGRTAKDIELASAYIDWDRLGEATGLYRKRLEFLIAISEPMEIIRSILNEGDDKLPFVVRLIMTSQVLSEHNRKEDGRRLVSKAISAIEALDPNFLDIISGDIAAAALACGDLQQAIAITNKIEEMSGSIDNAMSGVCNIAKFMAREMGFFQAIEYLKSPETKIAELPEEDQAWAYQCISDTQMEIGDKAGAQESQRKLAALPSEKHGAGADIEGGSAQEDLRTSLSAAIYANDWDRVDELLGAIDIVPIRARVLASVLTDD